MEIREIKFRGKRIDNGEWVEGDLITKTPFGECIRSGTDHGYTVDPTTIGQFTGLRDKHGEEIYEGDLFKRNGHTGIVRFRKGRFVIEFDDGKIFDIHSQPDYDWWVLSQEIIGTIHDKELKE